MRQNSKNVRSIIHTPSKLADKAADIITSFVGSWLFIGLHSLWFLLWIGLHIEPFPFGLLTMIVSLEAIYLSTFVMLSQNRQASRDHARDDLEAKEVDDLASSHALLLDINKQQLDILSQEQGTKQALDSILQQLNELQAHIQEKSVRKSKQS